MKKPPKKAKEDCFSSSSIMKREIGKCRRLFSRPWLETWLFFFAARLHVVEMGVRAGEMECE